MICAGLSLANIISHNSQPIIVHHASIPRNDPPKFSSHYEIEGVLRLPYAELEEPFKVWFDGPNTRSRIDYYGGKLQLMFSISMFPCFLLMASKLVLLLYKYCIVQVFALLIYSCFFR